MSDLMAAILEFRLPVSPYSHQTDAIRLLVSENMEIAAGILLLYVIQAEITSIVANLNVFPDFRPPYWILVGVMDFLKAPSCSPVIFRKSHQSASVYSKRFGNGSNKSGLGGNLHAPLGMQRLVEMS